MDIKAYWKRIPDRTRATFRDFVDRLAEEFRELPAMLRRSDESSSYEVVTYGDLARRVRSLGSRLVALGMRKGDRVGILSENRPEWCAAYLAALYRGLVAVPLDASLDAESLSNNLSAAACAALVFSERHDAKLDTFARTTSVTRWIRMDGPLSGVVEAEGMDAAIVSGADGPAPTEDLSPDDTAVVFYTSGTTGVAKGIVLTHGGILANVDASIAALHVDERDVFVAILPLHHTYAATCAFLAPLDAGGRIVFPEKLIPTVILRHVRDAKVTFLIGVPLLFDKVKAGIETELTKLRGAKGAIARFLVSLCGFCARVLRIPLGTALLGSLRERAGLRSVRLIVSGGGPLSPDTASFYDAIGIKLVQGYGMSENGPLISVNLPGYRDNRSVGVPVKRTDVRIADPGPDGVGEIQVRSPSLMKGYLDAPDATVEVFTSDGWLKTGDLGYVDRRGFVFITGRSKSLIVTEGGKNVYPEEIESKFAAYPDVLEVLVLGRRSRDGHSGEEVVAVCVPARDSILERHGRDDPAFVESLVRQAVHGVNKRLPQYMKITDYYVREREFEKTSTRKIRRFLYKDYANPRK